MAEDVPFVELAGSNFEIGRQLGEYSRERLRGFMEAPRVVEERERILARPDILSRSLRASAERYPRYMEEMRGLAEGAGLRLEDVFIYNWRPRPRPRPPEGGDGGESTPAPQAEGCTTLIVPRPDRVLIAHNEDWYTGTNDIFAARLRYENGLDFLGVCYHGFLPGLSAGINQWGLVQALNNLISSDGRAGVPLALIYRASLESAGIDEAVKVVTQPGRADSENFDFAQGGRAVFVETSAAQFELVEVSGPTVHTNHFLAERLKPLEASERLDSTLARHARATALLEAIENPGPDDLRAILASHEDWPTSICRHGSEPGCDDFCDTLGTIIADTAERALEICYGPPCRSKFRRFTL